MKVRTILCIVCLIVSIGFFSWMLYDFRVFQEPLESLFSKRGLVAIISGMFGYLFAPRLKLFNSYYGVVMLIVGLSAGILPLHGILGWIVGTVGITLVMLSATIFMK